MIPGPSEPPNINTFLAPLVNELKEFETSEKDIGSDHIFCILFCVANDIFQLLEKFVLQVILHFYLV